MSDEGSMVGIVALWSSYSDCSIDRARSLEPQQLSLFGVKLFLGKYPAVEKFFELD